MFVIDQFPLAITCAIITMICWGSWPNMQKLVSKHWRFELFYWDYVIGIVLVAFVLAVTLGSSGDAGRSFFADVAAADFSSLLSACIGGAIFNAGNILFIAALTFAGMAVAFPIGAGLSLVMGVILNYLAVPSGEPLLLFGGVGCVIVAIILSAISYRRASSSRSTTSLKGILLAIGAAVLFGFFYRFLAASLASDFVTPEPGKLTPYTAVVFFGVGVLVSNFFFNTLLMYKPLEGTPVGYRDYFRGKGRDHVFGVLGGMIWGLGLGLSLLSSGLVGYAASFGLGQGNAMIAAIWGVFVWKEFAGAGRSVRSLIACMFLFYLLGLFFIIYSKLI